jgi:hypothetical protein
VGDIRCPDVARFKNVSLKGDRDRIRDADSRCDAIADESQARIAKALAEHGLCLLMLVRQECEIRKGDCMGRRWGGRRGYLKEMKWRKSCNRKF